MNEHIPQVWVEWIMVSLGLFIDAFIYLLAIKWNFFLRSQQSQYSAIKRKLFATAIEHKQKPFSQ